MTERIVFRLIEDWNEILRMAEESDRFSARIRQEVIKKEYFFRPSARADEKFLKKVLPDREERRMPGMFSEGGILREFYSGKEDNNAMAASENRTLFVNGIFGKSALGKLEERIIAAHKGDFPGLRNEKLFPYYSETVEREKKMRLLNEGKKQERKVTPPGGIYERIIGGKYETKDAASMKKLYEKYSERILKDRFTDETKRPEVKIELSQNSTIEKRVDMEAVADMLTNTIVDLMQRSSDGIYW